MFRYTEQLTGTSSLEGALEQIRRYYRANGKITRVRCAVLNGGVAVQQLLAKVKPFLANGFDIEIIVWDQQISNLGADDSDEMKVLSGEMTRLDRAFSAFEQYDSSLRYGDFAGLSGEYLVLGSNILRKKRRHPDHIDAIQEVIDDFEPEVLAKNGSIVVRKCPHYTPGRIMIVDDLAFVSLYLYGKQVQTTIGGSKKTALYQDLDEHFVATWDRATGLAFKPIGRKTSDEEAHWSTPGTGSRKIDPRIFMSYRREDTGAGWATGRLYDRLIGAYTRDGVFLDHQNIVAGDRFSDRIEDHLDASALVLVMIGPNWLDIQDSEKRRRLDSPDDWVAREIETALARSKNIVPVLIADSKLRVARMPREEELPERIKPLAKYQAQPLRWETFREDAGKILEQAIRLAPP